MARNSNGQYYTKVTNNNGNASSTIWCRKRITKTGKTMYSGSWVLSNGKRFGVSFMPMNKKMVKDRNGKDVEVCPVQITALPDNNVMANDMAF